MKYWIAALIGCLAAAAQPAPKTYVGVITDSMCGLTHSMGIMPDEKCVRVCNHQDPKRWKYALVVGKDVYVLSDQKTPEQFAAKKVKVTGLLYEKTKIIRADRIELVR